MNHNYGKSNASRRGGTSRVMAAASAAVAVAVLLITWALDQSGLANPGAAAPEALKNLRISEVQSHNALTLTLEDGSAPSWIEIENAGDERVSLHAVCLARDARLNKTFVFPDIILDAGECALVYADGRATIDASGALHAGFRLPSSAGATLYLFDAAQRLLDSVEVPAMAADDAAPADDGVGLPEDVGVDEG